MLFFSIESALQNETLNEFIVSLVINTNTPSPLSLIKIILKIMMKFFLKKVIVEDETIEQLKKHARENTFSIFILFNLYFSLKDFYSGGKKSTCLKRR